MQPLVVTLLKWKKMAQLSLTPSAPFWKKTSLQTLCSLSTYSATWALLQQAPCTHKPKPLLLAW
jgi:hypothetical protein